MGKWKEPTSINNKATKTMPADTFKQIGQLMPTETCHSFGSLLTFWFSHRLCKIDERRIHSVCLHMYAYNVWHV